MAFPNLSLAMQCSAKHDLQVGVFSLSQFCLRFPFTFQKSLVVTVSKLNRHEHTICFHAQEIKMMTTFGKGFRHSTIQRFVHSICSQSSYVRTEQRMQKVKPPSKHAIEFNEVGFYENYKFILRGKITYPLKY